MYIYIYKYISILQKSYLFPNDSMQLGHKDFCLCLQYVANAKKFLHPIDQITLKQFSFHNKSCISTDVGFLTGAGIWNAKFHRKFPRPALHYRNLAWFRAVSSPATWRPNRESAANLCRGAVKTALTDPFR